MRKRSFYIIYMVSMLHLLPSGCSSVRYMNKFKNLKMWRYKLFILKRTGYNLTESIMRFSGRQQYKQCEEQLTKSKDKVNTDATGSKVTAAPYTYATLL